MSIQSLPVEGNSFDLSYRPRTYFWASERAIRLATDIQGARRKMMYEASLASGEEISPELTAPTLSPDERQAWGRIHPQFMGGEYLTRQKREEVLIARLTINSTTADTFAIYAKKSGQRIRYRAVDEYEGTSLGSKNTRSSNLPLTLAQLVDFAMEAWAVRQILARNFEDDGFPSEECQDFLMDIDSGFYGDFEAAMRVAVGRWLETVAPSHEDDEPEADEESV